MGSSGDGDNRSGEREPRSRGADGWGPLGAGGAGETRCRTILQSLEVIVWELDSESLNFTYVSPQIERILGYTPAEAVGRPGFWREHLHPEERERVIRQCKRETERGEPHELEYRFRHADGGYVWFRDFASVVPNPHGPALLRGVLVDVTEQKRIEYELRTARAQLERNNDELQARNEQRTAELRDSQRFLRAIVDNIPMAVFVMDADELRYSFVNKMFQNEVLGLPSEEILGKTDFELFDRSTAEFFQKREREMLETGRQLDVPDEAVETPNGRKVFHVRETPLRDSQGRVTHALGIAQDVTEKREAEEELRRYAAELEDANDKLEQEVAERKAAQRNLRRSERALRKAKEKAEAASRAKSEFLANMSHEIRTPMNGIIGMGELLRQTDTSPRQRDYLELVEQSAHSLMQLLNDILDFSKIEAGKLTLEVVPFDLDEALGGALKPLAATAAKKGLELVYHIAPETPRKLLGDPGRLRQAVINLADNAVKFTEEGEVIVDVECEQADGDEVTLLVSVSDTGIGIPKKQQEQIFEAFSQVDASTTRSRGGTGLGLAITNQLVALMGGRLWLDSEPGEGSTFCFTATLGLRSGEEVGRPKPVASLDGLPVLIVDDNQSNRQIFSEMLSLRGMKPTAVSSGERALEVLDEKADAGMIYPVVLLDAYMPGLDGYETARCIRQNERFEETALMVLSSATNMPAADGASAPDIARHLIKPVTQSDLLEAITEVLGVAQATEAPSERAERLEGRRLRVLLAEDSPINQRLAVDLLERRGHQVVAAVNGREAVTSFEDNDEGFDLALMDIQMPEMDGLEATRRIRELEEHTDQHLPIIALTAYAMQGDRERALGAGMDDYLSKPLDPQRLYAILEEHAGAGAREASGH